MFHAGITDTFIEPERFYPGAHVFFVGSCRDVCLFEDAGFELRDCVFDFGGGLLWWLLRRPVVGTVAANVLTYGVGGLNIDGSRIGTETISVHNAPTGSFAGGDADRGSDTSTYREHTGRWPANIILDPYTAQLLDKQSGISKSTGGRIGKKETSNIDFGLSGKYEKGDPGFGDVGGASRFFFIADQPTDTIKYLTNLILPTNGKLFFQLKEQETHDR